MIKNKDVIVIVATVVTVVLVCNLLTPFLYNNIPTDRYRTTLILNKIQEPGFSPDVVVFGSSEAMAGIDGYQMSKDLGLDVYNFSSTGQPQEESSLYYSKLPSSTKAVIQVIYPPILKKDDADAFNTLGEAIETAFIMGGYELDDETQSINNNVDLSGLKKNRFLVNFDARGAIVIPGITYWLLPRDKKAYVDMKFCNSDLRERHAMYQRTLDQAARNTMAGKQLEWDTNSVVTTEEYATYLAGRGIKMYVVLMPKNPDNKRYTAEQMEAIAEVCKKGMPHAIVLNYLNIIDDPSLFYDAEHLNHQGAKVLTDILDRDIKEAFI